MDAVEYEKGRRRMCRTNILKKGSCEGCDAYSVLMRRCDFTVSAAESEDENVIKKNIAAVKRWVKANPVKTRQSEFLKMFPNAHMVNIERTFCVAHFDSTKKCKENNPSDEQCIACRYKYWNEEVTDND